MTTLIAFIGLDRLPRLQWFSSTLIKSCYIIAVIDSLRPVVTAKAPLKACIPFSSIKLHRSTRCFALLLRTSANVIRGKDIPLFLWCIITLSMLLVLDRTLTDTLSLTRTWWLPTLKTALLGCNLSRQVGAALLSCVTAAAGNSIAFRLLQGARKKLPHISSRMHFSIRPTIVLVIMTRKCRYIPPPVKEWSGLVGGVAVLLSLFMVVGAGVFLLLFLTV